MIVVGILAGPTLATCFDSPAGVGACVRDSMTEAGILPQQATIVAEPEAEAPESETLEPGLVPEAPDVTPDVAPAAEPAETAVAEVAPSPPAFSLLRAEPDGSMVIAGTAEPGAEIEVFANGELFGSIKAEPSGDWALVSETPLAPGGAELTVGVAGSEQVSEQSFVVVVDPQHAKEPLVVASRPGEASDILQGLAPLTAPVEPPIEVAALPEEPAPQPAVEPLPVAPEAEVQAATEPDAAVEEPTNRAIEVMPPASAEATAPVAEPVPMAMAEPEIVAPETPAPAAPMIPPTIDAIEIDAGNTFFAGNGTEGATVRLYIDNVFVADGLVEGGRWLIEAGDILTKPSQRVRIDMLAAGTSEVAARAEVNFVIELPVEVAPTEEPTATAEAAPQLAVDATLPTEAEPVETASSSGAQPAEPEPVDVAVAAPPADAPDRVGPIVTPEAGTVAEAPAEPLAPPATKPKGGLEPAGAAVMMAADATEPSPIESKVAAIEPAPVVEPMAAVPEIAAGVEDKAVAQSEPVTAEPEVPADAEIAVAETAPAVEPVPEGEIPTLTAVSVGDPEAQRFASGKAIIRRGDNLWTIARRVYGRGIKYTTIFEANTDQIRDPHWIYPGQVFALPEGETE